ncbi:hypothetical protein DMENIID0001_137260 [Sergentomyia squamirostris]
MKHLGGARDSAFHTEIFSQCMSVVAPFDLASKPKLAVPQLIELDNRANRTLSLSCELSLMVSGPRGPLSVGRDNP